MEPSSRWGKGNTSGLDNRNVGATTCSINRSLDESGSYNGGRPAGGSLGEMTYATSTYWRYRRQRALPYGGDEGRRRDFSTDALFGFQPCDHRGQSGRRLN